MTRFDAPPAAAPTAPGKPAPAEPATAFVREAPRSGDRYRPDGGTGCGPSDARDPDGPVPDPVPDAEPSGPVDSVDPGEVPDPFTDADALDELGHEITTLAAHIAAATHRFLVLLAGFDRRRGWELGGHRSCADWLHVATAMDPRTARSRVRVARALQGLPKISEAMSRGELSFSQVRALTRVATPECEEELIDYARSTTVADLERFLRMWRTLSRADEAALERERHRLRRFSVHPDDEGMYVVRGRVPAEVGAVLMRAIEAASDALFCADAREETTPRQRRADALGLVAERAMAAGFGGGTDGSGEPGGAPEPETSERDHRDPTEDGSPEPRAEQEGESPEPGSHEPAGRMDAPRGGAEEAGVRDSGSREPGGRSDDGLGGVSAGDQGPSGSGAPAPLSGTRAERYQVMLHVKAEGTHLEDGTGLSHETSRRLSCDSSVVRIERDADGSVLDVGRRTRTVPPALRRALEVRDKGCRFPGCGLRFTDGHHLIHWQDGGETNLENLVLLCRFHHRLVHEGKWTVEFWGRDRHAAFVDPVGGIHMDTAWTGASADPIGRGDASDGGPQLPALANERSAPELPDEPVRALMAENETAGVEPTGWTLWAEYERAADLPWPLRARALEALDATHFGV